jgi:hypothetical protein
MGSACRRKVKTQRVVKGGRNSTRNRQMTTETLSQVQTSYRGSSSKTKTPFASKEAEHKATERSRRPLPEDPAKRQRVLENLMADEASALFVDNFLGVKPKEMAALKLLASNLREINAALNANHGAVRSNQVRHLKKIVCAVVASDATRDDRLLRETARLTGCERHSLSFALKFRERLLKRDVNALFTLEVSARV